MSQEPSSNPSPTPSAASSSAAESDRRVAPRARLASRLTLRIEPVALDGHAENISRSGVLFFTENTLRVTVEIEDDGVVRERPGRLVRAERIRGEQQGWAVEFGAA